MTCPTSFSSQTRNHWHVQGASGPGSSVWNPACGFLHPVCPITSAKQCPPGVSLKPSANLPPHCDHRRSDMSRPEVAAEQVHFLFQQSRLGQSQACRNEIWEHSPHSPKPHLGHLRATQEHQNHSRVFQVPPPDDKNPHYDPPLPQEKKSASGGAGVQTQIPLIPDSLTPTVPPR